ncbi:MAG: hypothetical protein AB7V13_04150 [Pseudorhodoplanes sp.]
MLDLLVTLAELYLLTPGRPADPPPAPRVPKRTSVPTFPPAGRTKP